MILPKRILIILKMVSNFFKKIQPGEIKLEEVKKLQNIFNYSQTKYQEENVNQKTKKVHWKILNCFTNHEKLFLNYLKIIL